MHQGLMSVQSTNLRLPTHTYAHAIATAPPQERLRMPTLQPRLLHMSAYVWWHMPTLQPRLLHRSACVWWPDCTLLLPLRLRGTVTVSFPSVVPLSEETENYSNNRKYCQLECVSSSPSKLNMVKQRLAPSASRLKTRRFSEKCIAIILSFYLQLI